jgi:hypothetical protein
VARHSGPNRRCGDLPLPRSGLRWRDSAALPLHAARGSGNDGHVPRRGSGHLRRPAHGFPDGSTFRRPGRVPCVGSHTGTHVRAQLQPVPCSYSLPRYGSSNWGTYRHAHQRSQLLSKSPSHGSSGHGSSNWRAHCGIYKCTDVLRRHRDPQCESQRRTVCYSHEPTGELCTNCNHLRRSVGAALFSA